MPPITSVAAIIPMRHNSERIPYKNFRDFRGRPLYAHIIETLIRCKHIDEILIDTDSQTIRDDCAQRFPAVRVTERPEHLRDGGIPMNRVLQHSATSVASEWILQTHSTNPLLRPATLERAIEALSESTQHDSLFGVTEWHTRLYDHHGQPINHNPAQLLRTQDLPPIYEENSNVYLFHRSTLERLGRRIGDHPLLFEIDRLEAVDIDDDTGWRLAEAIAHMQEQQQQQHQQETQS
ncbi:MAG: acylneuraminate cytidylyltransferase family protein [Planctomycetota bacterium]